MITLKADSRQIWSYAKEFDLKAETLVRVEVGRKNAKQLKLVHNTRDHTNVW